MRFFSVVSCTLLAIFMLTGCTAGQSAAAVASAGGSYLASHVDGATITYNPSAGTITGGLVFKDGRWVRGVGPIIVTRATDCTEVPATRSIAECVEAPAVRSIATESIYTRSLPADVYGLRSIITGGGGVRQLTGALVSTRTINRAVAQSARQVREDEKETFRALKEIHEAENTRLKQIELATNPSMLNGLRRFARGTPCIKPIPVTDSASVAVSTTTSTTDATTQTAPALTDPANVSTQPFELPPSGIMKSAGRNVEDRLTALEEGFKNDQKKFISIDTKLDSIIASLSAKK